MKKSLLMSALAASLITLIGCGCTGSGSTTGTTGGSTGTSGDGSTPALKGREMPTAPGNTADGDTIKIGLIASLNGEQQPWGVDSKNGAELAVEEINAAGGIQGKKIELIIEDTGSKPEGGKSATEKLVSEDKVLCVLGEVASGITLPAAQVCQANAVPIIAIGATRVDVTQQGGASFRVCYTDDFQGAAMAKYAYEDLGLRKVAILTDRKLPYSTGLSEVFAASFKGLGGEIVAEEKYESGNIDFKAQLTNIKAKNPDGLFCSGYFTEVGPIARQRQSLGLNVPMLGGDGWDSKDLLDSGGDGIVGGFFANHYHISESRPEVASFVANYKKKFGADAGTAMAALTYDAANVCFEALKKSTALDSKSLISAIQGIKDFKGVSGSITIGADGNAQKPALVLKVNKDGFVPVKQVPFFVFKG
ncbi:MAG: ABC transporter substrate-binding protein [Chlorobia bacterium]|nr:ABC transporter substrate-binding protein [Fimbriimonadaceae bacterium]